MILPTPLFHKVNIHRRDLRVFWLLVLLCTLLWLPPIIGLAFGFWPLGEDAVAFFVPMREFTSQAIRQGMLPLWNPYTFCGMPFMANSQVAFWYPPNWLLGFLPSHWALVVDLWLHTLLMAIGGYVLARSLGLSRSSSFLMALILSLASPITARAYAGHMTWQAARAYFPWMLWSTWQSLKDPNRVWWIWLVVFSSLCILAGHPPMMLLGFCLCTVLVIYRCIEDLYRRRKSVRFVLRSAVLPLSALCFAGVLSACALLPMRELAAHTVHGSQLSFAKSAVLSGTWKTLMRLFAPDWFGGNQNLQWSQACCAHEESAYIGVLPLLLALIVPWFLWPTKTYRFRVLALWWLLVFSILMALGANAPFYGIVWHIFPPLQMTRIPVRWLECLYLAGALLGGFAFRAVFEKSPASRKFQNPEYSQWNLHLLGGAVTTLLLFFGVTTVFVLLSSSTEELWTNAVRIAAIGTSVTNVRDYSGSLRESAFLSSVVVIILCGITLFLISRWRRASREQAGALQMGIMQRGIMTQQRLRIMLIVFVAFDLLLHGWMSAELVSPVGMRSIQWPSAIVSRYEKDQRWDTSFYWQAINGAVPNGVRLANGYDPLGSKRFFNFASAADGREKWDAVYQPTRRSSLWNVAGVTHTVARDSALSRDLNTHGWQREVTSNSWELWKHTTVWPLFYTTKNVVRVPERQQLRELETLAQKPVTSNWPVVTSTDFAVQSGGISSVQLQSQHINQAHFETHSSGTSVFVRSEAAFPGWRVWVNQKPVVVQHANYLFQAVRIPDGRAQVGFVYEPQTMRLGIFISLCSGAFLMAMIVAMTHKIEKKDEV
jgi:hypothetical protein